MHIGIELQALFLVRKHDRQGGIAVDGFEAPAGPRRVIEPRAHQGRGVDGDIIDAFRIGQLLQPTLVGKEYPEIGIDQPAGRILSRGTAWYDRDEQDGGERQARLLHGSPLGGWIREGARPDGRAPGADGEVTVRSQPPPKRNETPPEISKLWVVSSKSSSLKRMMLSRISPRIAQLELVVRGNHLMPPASGINSSVSSPPSPSGLKVAAPIPTPTKGWSRLGEPKVYSTSPL